MVPNWREQLQYLANHPEEVKSEKIEEAITGIGELLSVAAKEGHWNFMCVVKDELVNRVIEMYQDVYKSKQAGVIPGTTRIYFSWRQ